MIWDKINITKEQYDELKLKDNAQLCFWLSLSKTRMFYKYAKSINPLTYNEAKELLSLCDTTILLPPAALKRYICDEINHQSYGKTNERSRKLKIKWLVSEARGYYNYGTMNPEIKAMVYRYLELKISELKK